MTTSENANLSATSFVHSNKRVSWRVKRKIETGTVVTFASCPASLSHNVITCIYTRCLHQLDYILYTIELTKILMARKRRIFIFQWLKYLNSNAQLKTYSEADSSIKATETAFRNLIQGAQENPLYLLGCPCSGPGKG